MRTFIKNPHTGPLRGPEGNVEVREVELRLRGNKGWITAQVVAIEDDIRVRWKSLDGHELETSLPLETEMRWPYGSARPHM